MQTISEADHQLIREKLPIILHYARSAIPRSDIKAINAARRLLSLTNKLNRKHPQTTTMNSNTVNQPIEFPSFLSYTGTKTICAMPMGAAEAKRHGANITDEVVNKNLGNNGYLVEYPDGYRSWSPATQFEAAYRISETHVDRMEIELDDLKQRILKATDALYSPGRLTPSDRSMLETQVKAMQIYADVLFSRINKALNEEKREQIRCAAPTTAEGGEQ